MAEADKRLSRSVTLFPATALVVGSVVGSGIFVSSAQMARDLKAPWLLMAVWAFTGIMTLFGAFTQCELCLGRCLPPVGSTDTCGRSIIKSLMGIPLVMTGLPFFFFWKGKGRSDSAGSFGP